MSNTIGAPGPYDPTASADPSAPYFPLVATDRHAPATVEFWIEITRKDALGQMLDLAEHEPIPDRLQHKLRKCTEAELIAVEMRRYFRGIPEKVIDAPMRSTYTGAALDVSEMDEAKRKQALQAGVQSLRETAFHLSTGADALSALGELEPDEIVALQEALTAVNRVANAHTPTRPGVQPVLPLSESV